MNLRSMCAHVTEEKSAGIMGKWYVMNNGAIVNELYSADKLGDALKLAKIYKALRELNTRCAVSRVTVVKCGGVPMQYNIDGTQTHYL